MTEPQPAILHVEGEASARVAPDRFRATIAVRSGVRRAAPTALAEAAELRRALLERLRERHPEAAIADAAIAVREHTVQVEEAGRTDWRVDGMVASSSVTVEVPAAEAGAVLATAGAFTGTAGVQHAFEIAPARLREERLALQEAAVRDARGRAERLAAAAGLAVAGIVSIGETGAVAEPWARAEKSMLMAAPMFDAGGIEEALGEVRPEPVELEERVPVRFRLV